MCVTALGAVTRFGEFKLKCANRTNNETVILAVVVDVAIAEIHDPSVVGIILCG